MRLAVQSTLFYLLANVLSPSAIAQTFPTATIASTGDGDTLRISQAGEKIPVRLTCIDAPERNQPGGSEASQRLRQLLPPGQTVQIRTINRDQHERVVAEVYLNGRSLNLQLVQEGLAVVYPQFLKNCKATRNQYLQAEQQARSARLGFWSQSRPVMPWEWRQQRRK